MKNEMLALILAGGQGTRLGKLTKTSRNLRFNLVGLSDYRFCSLKLCQPSGNSHVGVITQYPTTCP